MGFYRSQTLACLAVIAGCSKAPLDTNVPVGELSLHIICRGEGLPPVVLEAGLGDDSRVWSAVLPEVADTTRVCAYDRAGMGASRRPAPRPHSNEQMADELLALLRAANVPEPFVLVGHSMGGANVRYLNAKAPSAVAGMVLVDSMSEYQPTRFWALLPSPLLDEFRANLAALPEGLDFETFRDGLEGLKTTSPSLGNLPLVVLARGKELPLPPGLPPKSAQQLDEVWRTMQEALPHLSDNSAYVVVNSAGHYIHLDQPAVVVSAVKEVVNSVRERRPINPKGISAEPD